MKNWKVLIIVLIILLCGGEAFAAYVPLYGKEIEIPDKLNLANLQVRGVWIPTVWQAFPKQSGIGEEEYKKEFSELLDNLEAAKINTIFFQLVPAGDAFYKSELNPVSEFLTGKQGENFTFDPLPYMIEETHKRGMSFHAWINPYRVTYKDNDGTKEEILQTLSPDNFARKNPDTVFKAGKKLFLKPWNMKASEHIKDIITEILTNYEVDGIHFDDYFYPAQFLANKDGFYDEEKEAFEKSGVSDIGDFRRMQTDALIFGVYQTVQCYNRGKNKNAEFGISPLGVWQNNINNAEGMAVTTNYTSYGTLFADTKKWVEEGWMDYVVPQIYWDFENKGAAYGNVCDWWANTCKNTKVKLYIGHASYKLTQGDWTNPDEIYNQMAFNSRFPNIVGSVFFDHKTFEKGTNENNQAFLKKFKSAIDVSSSRDNPKKENVKFETYKTTYGNLLRWMFKGDAKFFLIFKDGDEVIEIPKSGNSYFYLDYKETGNPEYKIEIE